MDRKLGGLIFGLFFAVPAAQASAPFCVVSQFGSQQCFYYSLDLCRGAARSSGGMCTANTKPARTPRPPSPPPVQRIPTPPASNILRDMSHVEQAAEMGRARREQREAAAPAADTFYDYGARQVSPCPAAQVTYRCQAGTEVSFTSTPRVGCTVIRVAPAP